MYLHSSKRLVSPLVLALALLVSASAIANPAFVAEDVAATLGQERDVYNSNKVMPLDRALLTDDGRVRVVVQFDEPPVALYSGGVAGLKATLPAMNGERKLDLKAPAVVAYRNYLQKRHQAFMSVLGKSITGAEVYRSYDLVMNGMGLAVDAYQVDQLARLPGVARVFPDKIYYAAMDASLPLVNAPDFWAELGGRDNAGAGVKVAVVDGGIRPENPMFDGTGFSYPPGYPLADDYCGTVDPSFCNGKLIVARHFRSVALHPNEFDTPLGFNGHGTHVSGIAVGNFVAGADAGDGVPEDISGVAPGAWLMAYKALWWNGTTGSGSTIDLIAAVEAAVADGADVINNSWGGPGGEDPATDAFGDVFAAANAAGVLSVVAAGNSGPGPSSIGCPGCHEVVLTVGNTTTNRIHSLGFELDGGSEAGCREGTGPALGAPFGPQAVTVTADVGDAFACSALPAGSLTGTIALVSRGNCSFADKAANVTAAGATFMVVYNNAPGAPIFMGGLESSTISSCMISDTDGADALALLGGNPGANGTVTWPQSRQTNDAWEDFMATSSSRGPNGNPDVLKPDIAAPGSLILSAQSPDQTGGLFGFLSGTSMASPHIAGAAALMIQQNPAWTPEEIKTALTSTAVRGLVKEDGVTSADPFDRGAGRLDLDRARRAGATFDLPSMAEDSCVGGCTFTRTITNQRSRHTVWAATTDAEDPNVRIRVIPPIALLGPGESAEFTVDVDTTFAPQNQWHFGTVEWRPLAFRVPTARLPVAVYAVGSSDSAQLVKTVDKAVAEPGEVLTYNITLNNLTLFDPIDLVDEIPRNSRYVDGSATALVNGVPDPNFVYDPGGFFSRGELTWSGQLDPLSLELVESPSPFGYVPLDGFFAPLTCSSVCDDTSITLSGGPLSFDYAGETYTSVVISSNGFIVAGDDANNAFTPFNQDLPDAAPPNNVIAPFWTDLDLDGTDPADSGAGDMYAGFLSAGPQTFLVMEWQNAELFGVPGFPFTFQIWIEIGTSNIWFTYASIPGLPSFLTVGVEDVNGTAGESEYFDGTGTFTGADLAVATSPGGTAELSFQLEAGCVPFPVINEVDVTSGDTSLTAFAATEIESDGHPFGACRRSLDQGDE